MRVAAYCRVSTEKDEQLESMENQKVFFNDFAKKNNLQLVKIYADEGISGKQIKNRTKFLEMLEDAKLGTFDMVFVKDISRFARNTVDFLNSIRELKSLGVDVKFLSNNQTILGDSEFILTIFSAMAQEESANLSKRVKFGKKINAQKGRVPTRVYGYKRIDNFTLVPDEQEATIVKKIFDMYVNQGYGAGKIASELISDGVPSKITGSPLSWCSKTIRRILINPIYVGKHINNKYEIKDFLTGERIEIPKHKHLHHDRPDFRIVSDEIYSAAQEKMNRNKNTYKNEHTHVSGRDSSKHLLSTLIKCEHCGLSFSRRSYTYKNTRIYWMCTGFNIRGSQFCNNRTRVEEEEILQMLADFFKNLTRDQEAFVNGAILSFNKDYSKNISELDIPNIDKQIKRLEGEKEKYKNMYLNGIIDIEELKESISEKDKKINDLNKKMDEFEIASQKHGAVRLLSKELFLEIESMLNMDLWTNTNLKRIIDKILVNEDGEIKFFLRKI